MKSLKRTLLKLGRTLYKPVIEEILAVRLNRSQETQVLLMQHYKDLVRRGVRPLPSFDEVGFRVTSRLEEDGILLYIFSLIGTTNKVSVEMCSGRGLRCNTTNLILNHGWRGYLFEGRKKKVERGREWFARQRDAGLWPPRFVHAWITAENVNDLLEQAGAGGDIDLFSLDMDGIDYWVWKALERIRPRVVVCEVRSSPGPERAVTVPYDPRFVSTVRGYLGASLPALVKLARQKGYRLVGSNRYGQNAFFIRKGIGEDLLPEVSAASCLDHPFPRHAMEHQWPALKQLPWVEV